MMGDGEHGGMELSGDELAGIVDQFGALRRGTLTEAVHEAAFRAGVDLDSGTIETWIDDALSSYALVEVELDGESRIVPGPRAFPTVPEMATDLTHVLDVEPSSVPTEALETGLRNRLESAAAEVEAPERAADLIDVTYDAEAWVGADFDAVRGQLQQSLDARES